MKITLLLFLLVTAHLAYGQNDINTSIDTSNYYQFFKTGYTGLLGQRLTTDWLRLDDIVPVVMDELKEGGYDWLYDRVLFKVDTDEYIVLAGYTRKSNFGFLYIEGHDMFPSISHRKNMTQLNQSDAEYVSCEETPTGEPNFVRIKKLPSVVLPLNENNYWFQYTDNVNDGKRLVTKESAIKILRQDIKKYLSTRPASR